MAQDYQFIMRLAACAAVEGAPGNPSAWADERRQKLIATPGWAEAYAAAQDACEQWDGEGPKPPPPGENEAAVTDDMIRPVVRALIDTELAATPPEPEE